MKVLGEKWRLLSDEEKEVYKNISEEDKLWHKQETEIYK
jgi:hypothetical protein